MSPSPGRPVPRSVDPTGTDELARSWADQVARLLDTLPTPQSAALRLLYGDRLSGTEAAARLGVTVSELLRSAAGGLLRLGEAIEADSSGVGRR